MRYTQNNIGMPFLQRGGGGCDPLPANHGRLTATSSIHRPRVRWSSSRTAAAAAAVAKSNDDSAEVEAEYFSNRSFDDTTTTSVAVTPEIGSSTVIYDPTATPTFLAQMSGSEGNTNSNKKKKTNGGDPIVGVGGYDPSEGIDVDTEKLNVGNPQKLQLQEKEFSVTAILKELKAIQQQGPQKYCILGTRHCSYMHQQIIELL